MTNGFKRKHLFVFVLCLLCAGDVTVVGTCDSLCGADGWLQPRHPAQPASQPGR